MSQWGTLSEWLHREDAAEAVIESETMCFACAPSRVEQVRGLPYGTCPKCGHMGQLISIRKLEGKR